VAKLVGYHHHQSRRNPAQELKKIGPADRSPAGRRRSPRRAVHRQRHQRHYSQISHQQQQPAHFGHIHLEDIVRGIESEFTLALDRDEGDEGEDSEDSLTYLVSGYENSGVDDEEEADLIASVRRLHQATAARRDSPNAGSGSAASSIAESTSPQSTLLNSSDARSEASVEAPSPSSDIVSGEGNYGALRTEQPVMRMNYRDSQPVNAAAATDIRTVNYQKPLPLAVEGASMALAATCEAINQKEKANPTRPSLTLQTNSIAGIAPGALSAFESRPLGSQYSLTKCNSTSSLYIDSTMTKSDVDETLRAYVTFVLNLEL